jgi:hypothetical protein
MKNFWENKPNKRKNVESNKKKNWLGNSRNNKIKNKKYNIMIRFIT